MFAIIAPLIRLPRGRDSFDYAVPEALQDVVSPGQIVDIPFRKRTIKGVIISTHNTKPSFAVRPIKKILTRVPFLGAASVSLAQSVARQTATPLSIVLKSFLPVIKVRELATLSLPAFTKNDHTRTPTHELLHWHDEVSRNATYRERATETLNRGQSVLVITPREPSIHELQAVFDGSPTVTISSDDRTHTIWDAWKQARSGSPIILIGLRSGVFAPFANLGLIIVDQEHDENLKQEEPNPRYHARSVAYELAVRTNADLLLASPIPSLDSFSRTERGTLAYYEVGTRTDPAITMVNLENEHKKDIFSFIAPDTITAIDAALAEGKSAFILVDRLGAATKLTCKDCGHEWKCPECGAYLALHSTEKAVRCQRCGFCSAPPDHCPKCRGGNLKFGGAGTERITSLATTLRPAWRIVRLDSLTAEKTPPRTLDLAKPAVIIGTRFAIAHLHKATLGLAIALTTDQLLARPEFKTHEDTYRMLRELARWSGHLIVYTRDGEQNAIGALTKTYREFYNDEARARERWGYPPFTSLTRLILQDPSKTALAKRATALTKKLKTTLSQCTVSEPYDLQPARVRGRWRMGILIKSKDAKALASINWIQHIDADTIVDVQPNSIT